MRDDGHETAGMLNGRRLGGPAGYEQQVFVGARDSYVSLWLSDGTYPSAGLAPAQARFLARKLYHMARLVDQRLAAKQET